MSATPLAGWLPGSWWLFDWRNPERHVLRWGFHRATSRGRVAASRRATASRNEAAAAPAPRRASAAAVAGAEASVPRRRERGELLLFTFGSQHHQMVRTRERTSHDTPSRSCHVSELQRRRHSRLLPPHHHHHFIDGGTETLRGKRPFPRPHSLNGSVSSSDI